jgi:predicted helicase
MIGFYNQEVERFISAHESLDKSDREKLVDEFINRDKTKISWDRPQKAGVARNKKGVYSEDALRISLYRPFTKEWLYYDRFFNNCLYQMPRLFPDKTSVNRLICVTGVGSRNGMSCLMSTSLVDLNCLEAGAQCFPLYLYEEKNGADESSPELFSQSTAPSCRDGVTDEGLVHFQGKYPAAGEGSSITKEDIFYYTYGILHSPDYRERFADNLSKELPRIPAVKSYADFRRFAQAGRELAELHIGYEKVEPWPARLLFARGVSDLRPEHFKVTKMKYGTKGDTSTVVYNEFITITGIPPEAYKYVVNGKSALDWVMDRQKVATDKKGGSGIVNDANLYATETVGDPRYPLDLFLRVIRVSMETMRIVKALPKLDI